MKKIYPVLLACLFGCFCAFILFKEVEEHSLLEKNGNVVAIQLGVFTDESSAEELTSRVGGRVFKDSDLYRVYYSILNKDENIDFITDTLNKEGVSYYLKPLVVGKKDLEECLKFESVMAEMKDEEKLGVNTKILNIYERSDIIDNAT